jgi:hypothetical protein
MLPFFVIFCLEINLTIGIMYTKLCSSELLTLR